jgi:phosphatidylglycerol---prolipoprotein diacylglyceryl transferase
MTFPVFFHIGPLRLHPHAVMEIIAYTGGFQLYRHLRRKHPPTPPVEFEQTMWILVGAILGALVGSKLLAIVESWPEYWAHRTDPAIWLGGKTIVGGLLGGWIGVEIAKRLLHHRQSTGDLFVFPLIFGMAVGRVGCFLTGLSDHTYGIPSSLPWAIDFGDGIPRHPTQIYEIFFLILLASILAFANIKHPGLLFRLFMLGYLTMRLAIEFIKPTYKPYVGLSAIQLACIAGIVASLHWLLRTHIPEERHAP